MAKLDDKKVIVDEIKANIKKSKSVLFVDYKGITVAQDTMLRKTLREAGSTYKVYKNRLAARALADCGISGYDVTGLEGTTSVVFCPDEVSAASIIGKLGAEFKNKLTMKFGVLDGKVINAEQTVALSKIPSKEVLIAMLLGMLNAPVAALARALNEIAKKGA